MRISVNLASHPYVELRPVYNRLRTWMVILALTGLALWFLYRSEHTQAEEAAARVSNVESQITHLEQQQRNYQLMMQQPKESAILQQSEFLNGLFQHKAFSWTATMTDLETVLPSGVQVLSIDPIVAPNGHVTIRLRVTGSRDRSLDLIRNLEKSKHFADPRVASETLATQPGAPVNMQNISGGNDVNFDILADYRPLPLPLNGKEEEEKPASMAKPPHATRSATRKTPRKPSPQAGGPVGQRRQQP